jgi:DNA sulfur modification protein DndC
MSEKQPITKDDISALYQSMQEIYLNDSRPWVIGYSGGKDSSCVLQAAWYALSALPREKLTKPIYVISSDTLVETPAVVNQLEASLKQIRDGAQAQGLPFEVQKVIPAINDTFWVNMIGKGIPAPYTNFRWCTERLKISPTTSFIKSKIADYGEVMIVLGSRRSESASRGQVMGNRHDKAKFLSWHNDIPNALVFTPIEHWSTDDVWTYIINTSNPWGGDNRELITMYRNAQAGECPLVIDKSTPSCGGGRFGCWTCTVVQKDRSMEAMIENGEDWMQPMLDLRDWLTSTQESEGKEKIRDHRRRNGRVQFFDASAERDERRRDGNAKGFKKEDADVKIIWGPYLFDFRKTILRKLLEAQNSVRKNGPISSVELIKPEELFKIRQLWIHEEGDWEDSLPAIYKEVTGESLDWVQDDHAGLGGQEKGILEDIGAELGIPGGMLRELFDVERAQHGMSRRSGIYDKIDQVLKKDWRAREEVLSQLEQSPEE